MKKIIVLLLIINCCSCKKTTVQPVAIVAPVCDAGISYGGTVKQLFITNCTASGCHDGVDLPSLAEYYVAHDAAGQIKSAVSSGVMPRNKVLSDADKTTIICWIENGAKNN
jgi:hypothetical protein